MTYCCGNCGQKFADGKDCLIVVLDTDTDATIVSRRKG